MKAEGGTQMVSWDAQVFSAVVSALLAFPGTEVTKLPKYQAPWVAPSPCHPHPRAATVRLVPDGGRTLWSFPMKDKGAGDQEGDRGRPDRGKTQPQGGRGPGRGRGEQRTPGQQACTPHSGSRQDKPGKSVC